MSLETVQQVVRHAEQNYIDGSTKLGRYVDWSMHDTIERIDAYLNSKHTSGETDSLGREKPFFNIVSAATNIWYRATDIDRKDIRFIPTKSSSTVLAFVANVILQNWMDKNRFGIFLNQWGRALARYGSAVVKFIEQDGELVASVVPWNRYIADPVQFDALPRIEKFYLTPAQLRKNKQYDQTVVDELITAVRHRTTIDRQKKDVMNDFIELYEVHGELDSRLLDDEPDMSLPDKDITYRQQMHVVSFVGTGKKDQFHDFTLYKGKEAKDPYMITHLIEEDGRTLSIGAVEYLFDAQWMQNHTVKNMKDTLDLASRLIFQTADTNFAGRNVLTAIETGDIMIHAANMPLERIANDKPDVTALHNFGIMWQELGKELTATPDAMRGNTLPSGTPYALKALQVQQSNSLFELMTENKGMAIQDMMRTYVIPHMKKQLKHSKEISALLDNAGATQIDSMYVPAEAAKRFNQRAIAGVLSGQPVNPFNPQQEQQAVKAQLTAHGNTRFFTPDDVNQKTWDSIFSDFEWDSTRVEVTNEQADKQVVMQTLSTVLQSIASNPMILNNPSAKLIFNKILSLTGEVSPLELGAEQGMPILPQRQVREVINFKDLAAVPGAQQAQLEAAGLQVQPQQGAPGQPSQPATPSPVGAGGLPTLTK